MSKKWIKTITINNGMGGQFGLLALYWQVIGALTEGREMYVDYRAPECCYSDPADPGRNVWELYFKQPYGKTIEQIDDELRAGTFGPHIRDGFTSYHFIHFLQGNKIFDHPKMPVIRDWVRRVEIRDEIVAKADTFYNANMEDHKILGIQKRGTDHYTVGHGRGGRIDINAIFALADGRMSSGGYEKIFLVTDEAPTLRIFKDRYKGRLIHYDDAILSETEMAIHQDPKNKGTKIGEDVLVEAILLSRCDYLLVPASNIALYAVIKGGIPFYKFDGHITYR